MVSFMVGQILEEVLQALKDFKTYYIYETSKKTSFISLFTDKFK